MLGNYREKKVNFALKPIKDLNSHNKSLHSLSSKNRHFWVKLKVYSKVIGRFIIIYKELKTFGSNKRSNSSIKAKKESKQNFTFHPKSKFKLFWNSFILILLLYTATFLPYRICFEIYQTPEWGMFDLCVDLVFFIDILINFNTGIMTLSQKLSFSRAEIAKQYLKSWFIVDLVSCIPLDFIITNESNTPLYRYLFRILRITKMYRIVKVIRFLKLIRFFRASFIQTLIIPDYFQSNTQSSISFIIQISLFVHISACVWYYVSTTGDIQPSSWLVQDKVFDKPQSEAYLACIYFVFTTFTTIGYGDITPNSNSEKLLTMILMGFGVSFYSYMISSLSVSIKKEDTAIACMKAKTKRFKDLAKVLNLPEGIKNRIKQHLKLSLYQGYKDIKMADEILRDLPSNIKDMILTHVNIRLIEGIQFFRGKKSTFVNVMAQLLQLSYYQCKDIVYEEGEIPVDVYFIRKGKIVLMVNPDIAFRVYVEGGYFGEIEVIFKLNREHTAKVYSKSAEMYSINKTPYLDILEKYCDYYDSTKGIAEARRLKHLESISDALKNEEIYRSSFGNKDYLDLSVSTDSKVDRNDTGVKTSKQHDTPFKRKNRKLWKTALLGSPVQNLKKIKRHRTASIKLNLDNIPNKNLELQVLPIKKSLIGTPKINKKTDILKISDSEFSEDISQLGIQETNNYFFGLGSTEEFPLIGSTNRNQHIEEKVRSIQVQNFFSQLEETSASCRYLSDLLTKITRKDKL